VANWERLATDPEIRSMWESEEMEGMKERITKILTSFKLGKAAGAERQAYHMGILEGLRLAEELPQKMVQIRRKALEQEAEDATKLRQFPGLRFGGV
jgi:hypothetical protein